MAFPKLRFKAFTNEISYKNLGSLITVMQSGLSRQLKDEDIGLPVLRSNNVQDFRVDCQDIKYWYKNDPQGADTNNYLLKSNDLLVNFINSTAQIGKSAIYNGELGRDAIITTNLMRLQFNNLIIPKFISYYFQTKKYEDYIQSITKPAVNQASFTTKEFQKLKVPYFSIEEQTKIASFLSAVDEKISQLTQKHELLSQYKQGMMQKLFSQQIRFKADDGSEFGEWENVILDDVILGMQSGLSRQLKDEDTGLIVLRSNNVIDNKISYLDVKYWYLDDPQGANVENYILEDGDILVNFINSMAQIGKSALYKKVLDRKIICTTNILRVQANKLKIKAEFLNSIFQTNEYENYIQSITKPAVNQASFTTKEFKMMKFKLPCLEEQTKIANFLSAIDQKIEVVAQQIEQAKQWKKGLLQQMFV
nr:restriction endonuclease subunit S [Acinetobacter schindleri]